MPDDYPMKTREKRHKASRAAPTIRDRIERGGERIWRFDDFDGLPFPLVAKVLSRLAENGSLKRLSNGVYYRSIQTAFGESRPNQAAMQRLAARATSVFPSGIAAARMLGFATQVAKRDEFSTIALSVPRKLIGTGAILHTRRPSAWSKLPAPDAALLDFLRARGRTSELSREQTNRKMLELLAEPGRFRRLVSVAATEPPRVRAILGALGEALGEDARFLERLRKSINPLTRFDFGVFAGLPTARAWQAKERPPRENR
jgi:Family of unknown function (DUF6088)